MKPLPGIRLPISPLANVRWARDIVYLDGPLLAEFRNHAGEPLLFSWCDSDETVNRWIAFRVRERDLISFTKREMDLRSLASNPVDGFVYVVDIDDDLRHAACAVADAKSLPPDYMPRAGSVLPPVVQNAGRSSYAALIEGAWETTEISEFPVKFQQAYLAIYVYGPERKGEARPVAHNYPWKGGFSSLHFYNNLRAQVPHDVRPKLTALVYASPGYIRWDLDQSGVVALRDAIDHFANDRETIIGVANSAYATIRENKLNDKHLEVISDEINELLGPLFLDLAEALGSVEAKRLRYIHGGNNFVCLKIVLSLYKRIRFLFELRDRARVTF